jgi:hypothetical protein
MAKPLMIQLSDDSMIEELKLKTGAKTKIDVVRQALNLLKADVARTERIKRWQKAAKVVGSSGLEVLREFEASRRFEKL